MKRVMKYAGWKLLLAALAVLLPVFFPVLEAGAAPMPSSGTLTIHNYALEDMDTVGLFNDGNPATNLPAGAVPLEGVEFSVWQVDPSATAAVTSAPDAWQYLLTGTMQTGVTNANGEVTFSLAQGLYYVAETGNTGSRKVVFCEPFLVSVPMTDPTTGDWITDVHAYPKNQSLIIDKFVGAAGGADYDFANYAASKSRPVAVGETFGWSILSALPANLGTANLESYVVTDILDNHFDYVAGSVELYAVPTITTPVSSAYPLTVGTDYTLDFNAAANTLTVKLTTSGMTHLGSRYTNNSDRYLLIQYDCKLNSTAKSGIRLYSGAELEYTRNAADANGVSYGGNPQTAAVALLGTGSGTSGDAAALLATGDGIRSVAAAIVEAEPGVHTGQIGITKLEDGTETLLPGAEFGLAVSKADAEAGNFIATGTTAENGRLVFKGLKYGSPGDAPTQNTANTTYWLAETKAPDGYKLVAEPVEVTFNYQKDSQSGEYYFVQVNIYNVLNGSTPVWGGGTSGKTASGTAAKTGDTSHLYLYLSLMALSLAAIIFLIYRKKKKSAGDGQA